MQLVYVFPYSTDTVVVTYPHAYMVWKNPPPRKVHKHNEFAYRQ
jgi:hypothetical protein